MTFASVLYRRDVHGLGAVAVEPDCFGDLNLDQIVAAVTAGKSAYDLKPFFHQRLDDPDDIAYRQEVMRDLEDPALFAQIECFARRMQETRSHLRGAAEHYYRLNEQGLFLAAVGIYGVAVRQLAADLAATEPRSRALHGFSDYLARYVGGDRFQTMMADTERVQAGLSSVRYCLRIRGSAVTVSGYDGEADYSAEIERTFAKFRQGEVKDYSVKYPELSGSNHIEAQIGDFVAKLNPDIFRDFDLYCAKHEDFIDPVLQRFDREIQFYMSYLGYIDKLRRAGLPFCYPEVSGRTKAVHGRDVFDLALADNLAAEKGAIVLNDFRLEGRERALIVSGPNQGGKTTFARTIGQLHYLAGLGCPVPGSAARPFLCDRIFTHFEREERVEDLRGKLYDDVLRIHRILEEATPDSLVVINEIFASTALEDAVLLASDVMRRILALDCLCVCVTFLDELASLGAATVSMVSTVVPDDPAQRTFKLARRPADGRAYAMAIADKYRLGYRSIRKRLAP